MTKQLTTLLVLASLAATAAQPARAGHGRKDHEVARAALARHEILPLTRILALAAQKVPGDVLKVELEDDDGRLVYELKVLARDGRLRELKIDARSGALLKIEDD